MTAGPGVSVAKRVFDIAGAALALLLLSPLLLFVALRIKLDSPGPVFFRQPRVGRHGVPFAIRKFRTMTHGATGLEITVGADPRITRVGAWLRRTRIDELPQFFNVLGGSMSLVGPRPERPYFVETLTRQVPYYAVRQSVKPGVTGWAQVRYHYGSTVEESAEKLQYDLYYVKNHTLFLDLVVLFETVGVVLLAKGSR